MTQPEMHDNFITLVVITPGEDIEAEFNINRRIRAVKRRAMQVMPPGTDPHLFRLEYDGHTLDEERKIRSYIEEFGWEDGTVLELIPSPEVI